MKIRPVSKHPAQGFPICKTQHPPGISLVVVLSAVVLLSMLVVAFLSLARTEQRSAAAFSDTMDARNLADLPINLAIGQIRRATEQNGAEKTWASQPGMLRVFGTEPDGTTGDVRAKTVALHKLYSDDLMVVAKAGATATTNGMTTAEVSTALSLDASDLQTWQSVPGLYVDINEPAAVVLAGAAKVQMQFPIADPRAIFPNADGDPVAGFNFSGNTRAATPLAVPAIPGTVTPQSESDLEARLPMPVRWLYLLADGRLIAPSGGNATQGLEFPAGSQPTAQNPITGRIAFWTDDESCKINVNTASEGTPWDVPRSFTGTEAKFARRLPAQNEFSRYPGHPAQTCLSPVFQAFGEPWKREPGMSDTEVASRVKRYHDINPRVPWGGSEGGSRAPTQAISMVDPSGKPLKDDRLYATLDELIFNRNREAQNPALTRRDIDIGRFFLTPHSRAPELNLFNKPRLLLWPISSNTAHRNPMDKLLAFLGTGGGRPWYLVRSKNFNNANDPGSSQSPTGELRLGKDSFNNPSYPSSPDRNKNLYTAYLQSLTGDPSAFSSSSGNNTVYNIPGFGGNFRDKYSAVRRDQILTEMFDFIRWSVNSYNSGVEPKYYYLPARLNYFLGESSAVPLMPGVKGNVTATTKSTKGFGRWPTITEAAIVFIAAENTGTTGTDGYLDTTKMRAFLILEPYSPTVGMPSWTAHVRYKISGLDQFSADSAPMGFPDVDINRASAANGWIDSGHSTAFTGLGGQFFFNNNTKQEITGPPSSGTPGKRLDRSQESTGFPFYSELVNVEDKTQFLFSGGVITIDVQTAWGSQDDAITVQRLTLKFPPATLPVPKLKAADVAEKYNDLGKRFVYTGLSGYMSTLIRDGDVTRSVEIDADGPTKGDLRILAATEQVPEDWFTVHPKYTDASVRRLHFLRQGYQTSDQYGPGGSSDTIGSGNANPARASTAQTGGALVKGMTYYKDCIPAVPRGLNGAFLYEAHPTQPSPTAGRRPGDWDNGTGRIEDGPYINKADEGNFHSNNQTDDGNLGYFHRGIFNIELNGITYTPNRQIASAVAFGSLSSGIYGSNPSELNAFEAPRPWQTLLFCPNPAARSTPALDEPDAADHEGFKGPRDHLWLDLWWMPVVEPYAVSEAFSTAGKINMNYQMLPFLHVDRSTGIHAAMKSTVLTAITPLSAGGVTAAGFSNGGDKNYKTGYPHKYELRYLVNTDATLEGFASRFNQGDVFRSASEICEIFLVPKRIPGATYSTDATAPPTRYANMVSWWNGAGGLEYPTGGTPDGFEITGDNAREAPYNQLYPRLTTKSNTFTIHYRVQMLKKARSTNPARWLEGSDAVVSEHRGSATLERYMDPNDQELSHIDIGQGVFYQSWDRHYRFRVLERKQFAP